MNIAEIRKCLGESSEKVYYNELQQDSAEKKNILLVSHCLDRGGAPLVLLELVDFFMEKYNVVFVSQDDGELAKEYRDKGLDIYIGRAIDYSVCGEEVWESFDAVFLNTLLSYGFTCFFQNRHVPVLWWLHEPEILFKNTYGRMIHFALLSKNIKILSVTQDTQDCVKKYYSVASDIFHMGLKDKYVGVRMREDEMVRFFMPAKFQMIKGQDILAQAILSLPPEYIERTEFVFAGPKDEAQPEYYELISKLSVACANVKMLGEITKDEVYEWYLESDCVIAPSRADATPTTIVEGMMFGKLCLCSDATGISRYMTDGVDGCVFKSQDIEALKEKIMYVVDNFEQLDFMRDNGRQIFLKHFEREKIESVLEEMLE